ncbi:hypothetical protein [Pseudomonas sp. 2FG]|uniref:hypothetical protein n=1 Tax=Pseudomonas sp. 2FG TaxID=2502191 RepID=UPI0014851367|nr:hypothetical protein [Pseudomonas sp. 2FG]
MSNFREFRFINGASKKALLVLEPKSSEFWIESGAMIHIVAGGGDPEAAIDVEYLPNGLVVYTAQGSQVLVYQDGCLLSQEKKSKRMAWRLNRP